MATSEHSITNLNWPQFMKMAKETWHKLTDEDLNEIKGSLEKLGTRLQEVYGLTKERAVFEIEHAVKMFSKSILNVAEVANEKLARASEMLKPKSEKQDSSMSTKTMKTTMKKANTDGHSAVQSSGSNPLSPSDHSSQFSPSDLSSPSDAPIFLKPNGGSMKKKVIRQNINAETVAGRPKQPEVRHH